MLITNDNDNYEWHNDNYEWHNDNYGYKLPLSYGWGKHSWMNTKYMARIIALSCSVLLFQN